VRVYLIKKIILGKIMHFSIPIMCCLIISTSCADTIDHYMNISNNIPKMEMKADPQSQAWARSAHNVLAVTTESIAETLIQANDLATRQGHALFCLPAGVVLDANTLNSVIVKTYQTIASQQHDKDTMTVSQVAWIGTMRTYPCQNHTTYLPSTKAKSLSFSPNHTLNQPVTTPSIQHMGTLLGQ
jgi:hypothetical protein